jgi:hypothetical protein
MDSDWLEKEKQDQTEMTLKEARWSAPKMGRPDQGHSRSVSERNCFIIEAEGGMASSKHSFADRVQQLAESV